MEMGFELAAKAKALGMKFTQASMYQINLNGVLPLLFYDHSALTQPSPSKWEESCISKSILLFNR